MRRLCFGGSFNPVHHGHLICARAVAEAGGFDRVVLVPSAQPPHKPRSPDLADPEDRLAMCRLAASIEPELFEVEDLELRRSGPSYTYDTVLALRKRGWDEVHWLIGADMLAILPTWYRAEQLMREAHLVIMARPGWTFDFDTLPEVFRPLEKQVVTAPLIDISATTIRQRVKAGLSISYLTPAEVMHYVQKHEMYRG